MLNIPPGLGCSEFCPDSKRFIKPIPGDCGCWLSGEVSFLRYLKLHDYCPRKIHTEY